MLEQSSSVNGNKQVFITKDSKMIIVGQKMFSADYSYIDYCPWCGKTIILKEYN